MRDTIAQRLREVRVRPAVGARERQRWDELMAAHHYLPFRTFVGRSLRHVAVLGERSLAGTPARSSSGPAMNGSAGSPSNSFGACICSRTTPGSWSCPRRKG